MKIKREIASVPVRSAGETWAAIVALISDARTPDAATLTAAASVLESLIADEYPSTAPITIKGVGNRLVIYCRYNEDAISLGTDIDPLTWNPTGGSGWRITAPSEASDVAWMNETLGTRAPRISVHDVLEAPADDEDTTPSATKALSIDWGVLGNK